MSEEQSEYVTEQEVDEALEMLGKGYDNAAEIHPPKTIKVLRDSGLEEIKVWGWVKTSTQFIYHIKKLKGAKLAIWQVIALSIDEDGNCTLPIRSIVKLSGYSRSEVMESINELGEMGYLSVVRQSGKKSIYEPSFAARGEGDPSRKTTGPVQYLTDPSSLSREKSSPSIKELNKESLKEGGEPAKPKPPKASDFPELVLFREVVRHWPKPVQWESIIESVQKINSRLFRPATVDDLAPFWKAWGVVSGNEWSLVWLVEWAVNGKIPQKTNGNNNQIPQGALAGMEWLNMRKSQEVHNG